jgi:hypothetical protein
MTVRTRRTVAAAFVAGVVTAAGLLTAATPAHAQPVVAGTFTMTGDPGDYITGGETYSYDVAAGDHLTIRADDALRGVSLSINAKNGDSWRMELRAPLGTKLAVGDYPEATRAPFSGAGAGIDIGGNGRGCNTIKGSFVVADVAFGPHGYVERLDATFEQHCEGREDALRGRVVIGNPPPAAPLEFTVTPAADGVFSKLNGKATVRGTVVCNADTTVNVTGLLTQVKRKTIIRGPLSGTVACVKGQSVEWTATADPTGTTPFQRGKAEVTGSAWANDPNYEGETVRADLAPTTVTLTRAPAAVEASM